MIDWLGGPLTLAEEQFLAVSGFLLAIFIFGKFMEIREAKKEYQEWKKIGLEISCSENVSGATWRFHHLAFKHDKCFIDYKFKKMGQK